MQLSVIILNYKVPYYLLLCLESVTKSIADMDAEIIVVDNNSEDESCHLVRTHFPKVKLIANKTNDGFSKGNNKGVKIAQGKYICLLNPDTVVGEKTFQNLIDFADKNPDFGAIGLQFIDGRGNFLPESKRCIPTPKVALEKLLNISKNYYAPIGKDKIGKVEILSGAFMLMRKDRYLEVGQLDEDYFMYGEDIDLSYKFIKAGYQNYYVGSETIIHYKGESTAKDKTYRHRFYGAMQIFYNKHFKKNGGSKALVNMGLQLAKITHNFRKQELQVTTKPLRHFWVNGNDKTNKELFTQIAKKTKQDFTIITTKELLQNPPQQSLITIDASQTNYCDIFKLMKQLNHQDNSFRLKPKSFNFIIGSDSNETRGFLLKIEGEFT